MCGARELLKEHMAVGTKQAGCSPTHLLWCTGRRSRSIEWSGQRRPPQQWGQKSPQNRSARPSWQGTKPGRGPGRTGSGWWWSLPLPSYWSWRAEGGWPLIQGRWRRSTRSVRETTSCSHRPLLTVSSQEMLLLFPISAQKEWEVWASELKTE